MQPRHQVCLSADNALTLTLTLTLALTLTLTLPLTLTLTLTRVRSYRTHAGIVDCAAAVVELLSKLFPTTLNR